MIAPLDSLLTRDPETISLSGNNFTGSIPTYLGGCTSLEYISLNNNVFHGTMPSELAALRNLKTMNIQQNTITGHMPPEVCVLQRENAVRMEADFCRNTVIAGCISPCTA